MWLHHSCLLGVSMVGRDQYGYITSTFSGSPWWGEINLGVDIGVNVVGMSKKWVKIGKNW